MAFHPLANKQVLGLSYPIPRRHTGTQQNKRIVTEPHWKAKWNRAKVINKLRRPEVLFMPKQRSGRPRVSLSEGARNVAWYDAVAAITQKSDIALNERYAKYLSDGSVRADGGRRDVFGHISRDGYNPARSHDARFMSVFEAVGRDPDPSISRINREIYESEFWRLLTPPPLSGIELRSLIDGLLARNELYRISGEHPLVDIKAGNTFLKDKTAFHYQTDLGMDVMAAVIASWADFDGLALLAALIRERLAYGALENLGILKQQFDFCLRDAVEKYGIRRDVQQLIGWLALYRVFSNRWDDVPTDETRLQALNTINRKRQRENKTPIKTVGFWVEALAIRYHNYGHCHRYPIVPKTPPICWLEANRATLSRQMDDEDSGKEVDGMYYCPIFDPEGPSTADAGRESESGKD